MKNWGKPLNWYSVLLYVLSSFPIALLKRTWNLLKHFSPFLLLVVSFCLSLTTWDMPGIKNEWKGQREASHGCTVLVAQGVNSSQRHSEVMEKSWAILKDWEKPGWTENPPTFLSPGHSHCQVTYFTSIYDAKALWNVAHLLNIVLMRCLGHRERETACIQSLLKQRNVFHRIYFQKLCANFIFLLAEIASEPVLVMMLNEFMENVCPSVCAQWIACCCVSSERTDLYCGIWGAGIILVIIYVGKNVTCNYWKQNREEDSMKALQVITVAEKKEFINWC